MAEKIIQMNMVEQYEKDMISYAIGVNRRRAIAEYRDGFKPVQRRILYAAHELGIVQPKLVKSSRLVGETMGKFHPHGDSSIYDAMPLMGNPFQIKIPLLYLHGNWGTVMGDSQAAQRYTECALSKFADRYIIGELNQSSNVVDWEKNFDDTEYEPVYLPVQLPILLINGSSGLGVGMMSEVPRHNPIEVIDVTRSLITDIINKTDQTKVILIPDQCQDTEIVDTDWNEISETGSGSFLVRGIIEIGEEKGYPMLYIKSLPDRVYSQDVYDKLNDLVKNKQLPMVKNINDMSKHQVNIVVQLDKHSNPEYVRNIIYKKTGVEKRFTVNMELVKDIDPVKFGYKEYIVHWIAQRRITKKRLYTAEKSKVDTVIHKLETYIKVMESGDIDYIQDKIKKSTEEDDRELIEFMIKKYNFTELQCQYILDKKLRDLSMAKLQKYKSKLADAMEWSDYYERRILDDQICLQEIYDELGQIREELMKNKEMRRRKTKIISAQDEIPAGEFLIVVTENNYIRKIAVQNQVNMVKGDIPKYAIKIDNRDNVLFFDNKGKVFKMPVHRIPVCDKSAPGIYSGALIKSLTADIISIFPDSVIQNLLKQKRKPYITVVTEQNMCKRLQIEDVAAVSTSGIIYTKLSSPDDKVVDINLIDEASDIIVYGRHKALRFQASEIPLYKRASQGVKAMDTKDPINGMSVIYNDATHVVVVTESGKINKFSISGLERSKRMRAGNSVIRLSKTDSIFKIYGMNDNMAMRIYTRNGVEEINVAEINESSSASAGTSMLKMKGNNIIKIECYNLQ